jgi:hypothetical protein
MVIEEYEYEDKVQILNLYVLRRIVGYKRYSIAPSRAYRIVQEGSCKGNPSC